MCFFYFSDMTVLSFPQIALHVMEKRDVLKHFRVIFTSAIVVKYFIAIFVGNIARVKSKSKAVDLYALYGWV